MRRLLTVTLLVLLGAAPGAAADGLPVPFDAAQNSGVTLPAHPHLYATAPAGDSTAVLKTARATGEISSSTALDGTYGVPLVAYDGTPSGLSGNGERLVLINPRTRFPRAETSFALLSTDRMRVLDEITLDGDFSFDALSPDGNTMYLIRYSDPRDPTAYEVRAYDLERGRLLPDPIIDPNESGEEMAGFPQTRAVGPGGRWAYTLYSSAERDHLPFIHALDTQRGTAVCIDLDPLASERHLETVSMQPPGPGGNELALLQGGDELASVDLTSFAVSGAPDPAPTSPAAADAGDPLGWSVAALGLGLLGAGALTFAMLRRRRARRIFHEELERA